MASNQTSNYGLNQWEATDQVLRTDFNADNAKIDAALKGLADKDTALEETLVDQVNTLAAKGNCQICYMSYVGNGGNTPSLTFTAKPLLVFIMGEYRFFKAVQGVEHAVSSGYSGDGGFFPVTWKGNTMSWNINAGYGGTGYGVNENGDTYFVVAFMAADE